jgi:hypothetical protein
MMAGVKIIIPGVGGQIEAKTARMAAAVQHQFNVVTAATKAKPRRPIAGDLGKRLPTVKLP